MRSDRRVVVGLFVAVSMLPMRVAFGQTADESSKLFDRGVTLMEAGDFAAACPLVQGSYDMDPKESRLFTLANCRDREGKIVAALGHYRAYLRAYGAMNQQLRKKHAEREGIAKERVKTIEAEVPKLKLVWREAVPFAGKVAVDGDEFAARLNIEWPFDPGEHRVVVERSGAAPETRTVTLERGKPVVEVDLAPPVVEKQAALPKADGKPIAPRIEASTLPDASLSKDSASPNMQRKLGFVAIGVGGAGIVAGGVLGALALVQKGTVDRECTVGPTGKQCSPLGIEAANDGRLLGNVGTVPLLVGAALVTTGIVLVLRAPKANASVRTGVNVSQGAFVGVQGVF